MTRYGIGNLVLVQSLPLFCKWPWSKWYYWHSKVCFLSLPSPWNQKPRNLKNKRIDFLFPIVRSKFISSKSFSSKDALLLGWSHRYKSSTVIITNWLTVMKFPYLKWRWIFSVLCIFFASSINDNTIIRLDIWVTRRESYKKWELLTFREPEFPPVFWWVPCRLSS